MATNRTTITKNNVRDLRLVTAGQGVSLIGDSITQLALPIMAVDLLGADHVLMGTDWPIVVEKSVLSGLARGIAETRNRPAIVDAPTGKGRVILFATNPCYRWQNHGEFGMLFNVILHHNDIKK